MVKSELMTKKEVIRNFKKGDQKFWRIKDTFFVKSRIFSGKICIFHEISSNCIENLTLGFLGVLLAHLGFLIYLEWQLATLLAC